jgi:hydrophobic/amphiphilic exporter-1 (mainly G- bacteria), HAE1 family
MLKSFFAGITRASLRFGIVTIAVTVLVLVLGVYAALQMRQELLPDIEFPQSFILTVRPGASAEDLRDLVTLPLEEKFRQLPGVIEAGLESNTSASGPAVSFITVRYEYGINSEALRGQIDAAIDEVYTSGIPLGLETTADLTPEIMTSVLTKAPSMWLHFRTEHFLAMDQAVLDAALAVNPTFFDQVDQLAQDQIAARLVGTAITATPVTAEPAQLPNAWRSAAWRLSDTLTGRPTVINFDLSSLPVITASLYSPNLSADELKTLIETDLIPALTPPLPGYLIRVEKITREELFPLLQTDSPEEVEEFIRLAILTELTLNDNDLRAVFTDQVFPILTTSDAEYVQEVIQTEFLDELRANDIANVRVSGGQQIPEEVRAQAEEIIAQAAAAESSAAETTSGEQPAQSEQPAQPAQPQAEQQAPRLPPSWTTSLVVRGYDSADDLVTIEGQTAAQFINGLAAFVLTRNLVADLPADVLNYLRINEAGFTSSLEQPAIEAIAEGVLRRGAWSQLLTQPGFAEQGIATFADLAKLDGSIAASINKIVTSTPAELRNFSIRLVDALSPEVIRYMQTTEPDLLENLDPAVLRLFSTPALVYSASFVEGITDDTLREELTAISRDPSLSAAAQLAASQPQEEPVVDDPNAPAMPGSWAILANFGAPMETANDLFKKPFGLEPAAFMNTLAENPNGSGLIADLTAEILLYVQTRDASFFDELDAQFLTFLAPEVLEQLPAEVQNRAGGGVQFTPATTVTRTNRQEALIISVSKDAESNTVAVSDVVEEKFREFTTENADAQISINTIFEQASFIRESISGVAREGGLGAVMAVVVILLFLNFSVRSTLVTAVSIPTSVAIAFVLMYWVPPAVHGWLVQESVTAAMPEAIHTFLLRLFPEIITLNIMTLSGLTVAIGRVVDDSIVVLENIYRQMQKGTDPRAAVIQGTRDVSVAIFAATLTTIVVFLPIGLTGGVVGEFFLPFGLAVTYSLAASFLVAITTVPLLALMFIKPNNLPEEKEGRMEHSYENLIKWALKHRWVVLGAALVTLVIGLGLFATRPTTFLPSFGEPQMSITVSLPPGTSIAETDARVRRMEEYLESKEGHGIGTFQTTIGSSGGFGDIAAALGGGGSVAENAASLSAVVEAEGEELNALTQEVRAKAQEIFGEENVNVSRASVSEQGFGGFAVVAAGPEADIRLVNDRIKETLASVPGITNVTSTLDQVGDSVSYLRIGGQTAVQYSANLEVADTLGVTREAIAKVQALSDIPSTLTIGEGFQSQQQTEGFAQTFGAMGFAILAVYVVMVITFGSLVHPFTILFSLPLAVVGAALGLTITNRVVGISALIGLLMLIGIVVTNAIVMIDRVQSNRKERGMATREALIEGARTRLRPILMTAIATMFALLPLAIGLSEGAIIAAELGTVVIGGLFSSTLLTLVVVPIIYSLIDAATRAISRRSDSPVKTGTSAAD